MLTLTYLKNLNVNWRYFKLKTDEGGEVLHIVLEKLIHPYIPLFRLKHRWFKIWSAKNDVNIQEVSILTFDGMSMYIVGSIYSKTTCTLHSGLSILDML